MSDAPLTSTHRGFNQFSPNICPDRHIFICGCINCGLPGCQIKHCYPGNSKMLFSTPKTTSLAVSKPEHGLRRGRMGREGERGKYKRPSECEGERGKGWAWLEGCSRAQGKRMKKPGRAQAHPAPSPPAEHRGPEAEGDTGTGRENGKWGLQRGM